MHEIERSHGLRIFMPTRHRKIYMDETCKVVPGKISAIYGITCKCKQYLTKFYIPCPKPSRVLLFYPFLGPSYTSAPKPGTCRQITNYKSNQNLLKIHFWTAKVDLCRIVKSRFTYNIEKKLQKSILYWIDAFNKKSNRRSLKMITFRVYFLTSLSVT